MRWDEMMIVYYLCMLCKSELRKYIEVYKLNLEEKIINSGIKLKSTLKLKKFYLRISTYVGTIWLEYDHNKETKK